MALNRVAIALLLASLYLPAVAHTPDEHAHGAAPPAQPYGEPGTTREVTRTIDISMQDTMRFQPSTIRVRAGETVRFRLRNRGAQRHEMVIGTPEELKQHAEAMRRFPKMEHHDSNMVHVRRGSTGELVWKFTHPGAFGFACLVPGHFEAGMTGTIEVSR